LASSSGLHVRDTQAQRTMIRLRVRDTQTQPADNPSVTVVGTAIRSCMPE
jgi:hypothetical protein